MRIVLSTAWLRILNVAVYAAMIGVNIAANALPLNNRTTGELSDLYPNLFTPAGFTFSIWSVIYLGLGAFIFYQTGIAGGRNHADPGVISRIGPWFIVSSLANVGWIFAWHYEQVPLSLAVMVILLVSLFIIYRRLHGTAPCRKTELWLVAIPFSIYFGWITVATLANSTVAMVDAGMDGTGTVSRVWTIGAILLATLAGLGMLVIKKDFPFALVIVWALAGILARHLTALNAAYGWIIVACAVGIVVLGVAVARAIPRVRRTFF